MSIFARLWTWIKQLFLSGAPPMGPWSTQDEDRRVRNYLYHRRVYDGYAVRGQNVVVREDASKRLIYNFARPICNAAAGFLASDKLVWGVSRAEATDEENKALTEAAKDVWDRSGGEGALLSAALGCVIHGDVAGIVRFDGSRAKIQFLGAMSAVPEFASADLDTLEKLTIAYPAPGDKWHIESWTPELYTVIWPSGKVVTEPVPGVMPAAWIRNEALLGDRYGRSDIFPIDEAVHEYDHVSRKQTAIIDYHANPTPYTTGLSAAAAQEFKKNVRSIWHLPENATCGYLEWKGAPPAVGEHLSRLRTTISELAETPAIAFGQVDSGFSGASGISLKVLYGPLVRKVGRKRHVWGRALRHLMWVALTAEKHNLALEDVDLEWPSPTPESAAEFFEELLAKQRLGASDEQLLGEAGYDENTIATMAGQRSAKAEADAARQQRIFNSGGQAPE